MKKMTILYKITFSALFIALGIILSRFFAGWNLFGLSFLKISLTMSVVFFASFYLGPLFGTIVSFSIDLFGALLIPQGGAYDFLYSIPAILEGFVPYFIYLFCYKTKIDRKFPIVLGILIIILNVIVFWFTLSHDTFKMTQNSSKVYEFTPALKVIICSVSAILSIVFYIGVIFFKKKFKDKKFYTYYNIYLVAIAIFATYFLVKVPISSLIFMYRLEYSYEIIFGTRALTGFFSSFVHLIIVCIALNVSLKAGSKGALIKYVEKDLVQKEEVVNDVRE